jgi:CheY-like chemotaxis protein/HPt (histidine-containing phosphotransfer) domain-containing protein
VPCSPASTEFDAFEEEDEKQALAEIPRHSIRVLVADDNPANQKVILRLLEKLRYVPEVVANGADAVRSFQDRPYDIILMDCQMPEMDGYQASRKIRKLEADLKTAKRIPIIALTANALSGDRDRCLEAGMDDYLSKPVTLQELARALEKWAQRVATAAPVPTFPEEDEGSIDSGYLASLDQLNAPGKPDLLQEIGTYFLEQADAKVASIFHAVQSEDPVRTGREAHSFKSTCFNVGASKLAAICSELENLACSARAKELKKSASPLLARLEAETAAAKRTLAKILASRETA